MLKHLLSYRYRTLFLFCFTMVGLITSYAVMSIGIIAMFVNVLLDLNYKKTIKNYFSTKVLFSIGLIFWASLSALSYSSDKAHGLTFVLNNLSFVVVPLAFSKMNKMTKENYLFLLNAYVFMFFITGIIVLAKYFSNFEISNSLLKQGQAIWVPINHIRYNTMLVFAFISSAYLFFQKNLTTRFQKYKLKSFYAFLVVFFFILINILSVRSALVILYLSLLVALLHYTINTKKIKILALGLIFIISVPIFFYYNVNSFKNRINYMKYDWQQILENKNIGSNSDSRRIVSYKLGFELVKESFPIGLGTGSTKNAMYKLYDKLYPNINEEDRLELPHNEFLYVLIDYGFLGFLLFIIAIFYPLVSLKNKNKHLFYILFWTITITPLLFDLSFESQFGIVFFSLFSSLILKQISNQEEYA